MLTHLALHIESPSFDPNCDFCTVVFKKYTLAFCGRGVCVLGGG